MVIVGIDGSTNRTGIAVFRDGIYVEHTLIDLHKVKNINERIPKMISEICKYIDGIKPDKILMEETVLNSNADTLKKLAYVAGGMMLYAHERGIEFELVLPSQWRKKIGLQQSNKIKREVLKQESIQAVKQEYGLDVTDDEADAILVCRSGFDLPQIVVTEDDLWGA